jgi:regulator of replication initiation timing
MNEYEVKQIIEYVNDESVSDHYGKWGALNREQRKKIRDLCNSWLIINEHDKQMTKENQDLRIENEKLKEKLNKITEIVRHKPAKTSDYVINYQSAMAQLESIVYVLKGLA